MFSFLAIVSLVIVFVLKFNYAKIAGTIGETRVQKQFEKLALENYKILNDIMIETDRGTSQIDHIVLSPYGIFVIETKNYTGWIHGSEDAENWTKTMYNNKIKFRNPIKQNLGHILSLKSLLSEFKNISYYPVIIFAGSAKLMNMNVKTDVINPSKLYETIINHRGIQQLTELDINRIYDSITNANIIDKDKRNEHVNAIRKNIKDKALKINAKICPKCGGSLVQRQGGYGKFYGCSNYPKCKYTAKL